MEICIVGGGASAMVAAITAARANSEAHITILEKKEKLGSKVLASGNGRCNISNTACAYMPQTMMFFESIGVTLREEEGGRLYPVSGKAKDVVRALELALAAHGVSVRTGCTVQEIIASEPADTGRYEVRFTNEYGQCESLLADRLLIASGGKASPQHGTSGDGIAWARGLGHAIQRLSPVLAPLYTEGARPSQKGIRQKAALTLVRRAGAGEQTAQGCCEIGGHPSGTVGASDFVSMASAFKQAGGDGTELQNSPNGVVLASAAGELQFTEDGISGICVFDLSRYVVLSEGISFSAYSIIADLLPEIPSEALSQILEQRRYIKGLKAEDFLNSLVEKPLALSILEKTKTAPEKDARKITNEEIKAISKELKSHEFKITGSGGWKQAQCTRGGVDLSEINMDTMESRLRKNLYFAGEIIDFDGPCGGYNLQNAWETGIKAGQTMACITE